MKHMGGLLLYATIGAAFFVGGAVLSMRHSAGAPASGASTDASSAVPAERAAGPPPGYEPPAPEDTPCLQSEHVARCIGRARARTGLMRLAGLQEARMRERGGYAEDAASLGWAAESGMELRMTAGPGGWTAAYRHVATSMGCAIHDGDVAEPFTTPSGGLLGARGTVACDDPLVAGR